MTIEEAKQLLTTAGVFFDIEDDEKLMLNMNDVWAWACADGEVVEDSELPELAQLFLSYGRCGIIYWVSQKRGGMRSEFEDNNRFIDFVAHEEQLAKDCPNWDDRGYTKITYTLGR